MLSWVHKIVRCTMAKNYHKDKLVEVRVRFVQTELVPDESISRDDKQIDKNLLIIRNRAKEAGFIDKRNGKGSVNAYILSLIEQDIRSNTDNKDFSIPKSLIAPKS